MMDGGMLLFESFGECAFLDPSLCWSWGMKKFFVPLALSHCLVCIPWAAGLVVEGWSALNAHMLVWTFLEVATIVPVPLEADWGVVRVESRGWVRLCALPCWLVVHYSCICLTSDFGTGVALEKFNVHIEESITAHGVPGRVAASLRNWAS